MTNNLMFRTLVLLVGLTVSLPVPLEAQQTTGKVAGRVVDASTGEALPGVNVVLLGTTRGATTNVNGDYFIILVSPGTYSVQASFVGYQSVIQTDVPVQIDLTSTVDFELMESSQQLDDLVVTAERPPVQMDISFTQTILGAGEVQSAPVGPRLRDAFATQVGIDTDDWGITIRGGNEEEITYAVDGVGQKDSRNNRSYSSYSKTALQEVQILTGGFNAEYGDVRSGVVNVVNKEPRQWLAAADIRYSGSGPKTFGPEIYSEENWWDVGRFQSMAPTADTDSDGTPDFQGWTKEWADRGGANGDFKAGVFSDPISTPEQAFAIWQWQHRQVGGEFQQNLNPSERDGDYTWDATVGGPLVEDRISFLLSNRRERSHYAWGMAVPAYRDDTWQGRLIYTPTATTKLAIGFIRGWSQGGKYGNFLGEFARSPRFEASNFRAPNIFAMGSGSNIENITRRHGTLTWTHTLSPKTFYNLSFRTGKTDYLATWQENTALGIPTVAVFPDGSTQDVTASSADAARAQGAVILDEGPNGFTYQPSSRDILNLYQMSGGSGNPARSGDWSWAWESDLTLDVTSQITPNHQIKAGVQAHHFYLREIRGYASTISDPAFRDQDYKPNNIDDPKNAEYTDVADLHNYWIKAPVYGGIFAQDRMEYRQIVVNLGLRLDFHRPDKYFDIPNEQHADWMGSNANLLYDSARKVQPPTRWAWSPRLGVSHPITVESKLYFNYGRFVQIPTSDALYETQSGQGEPLETFGNPWMEMPVTTAYELGYERAVSDYLVNTTIYFKDIERETNNNARLFVNSVDNRSTRFHTNSEVKDVRGIELSVKKSRGRFLTGFVSYDYRVDRRREVGWQELYDVNTTSLIPRLRIEANPDAVNPRFKARPIYKVGLTARTPLDYGAESRMWKGGWEGGIYFRHEAGEWFNYNPSNDSALRNIDNAQWTSTNRADLRISKTFDVQSTPMVYLEITNLLDSHLPNTNTSRLFETVGGPSSADGFRDYMEALGWRVDASGTLIEGKRPGTEVGPEASPRRTYMQFFDKRDVYFGVRFSL